MRDPQWLQSVANSPRAQLWGHWLRPYELGGYPIVPPDAVPTPTGVQNYGNCPEQMFPGTFDSDEGRIVSECFYARRLSTVSTVSEVVKYTSNQQAWVSSQVSHRFQRGGNAWFAVSPLATPAPNHDITLGWIRPEVDSPAMKETVDWLVLYLALGWEIPAWGPVPGVWFHEEEWHAVLDHVEHLVRTGSNAWIRLPYQLRRQMYDT
jgi:hypothetical protein